jgi:hypothetical protein
LSIIPTIVKLAILSVFLAFWEVFGKSLYYSWLESTGRNIGFGEIVLGYFIILSIATLIATMIARHFRGEGEK